jgi:spermidine/putrescine transport system permease protein
MAGTAAAGTRRRITPYLLSLPALAYLFVFFVQPLWALLRTSLSTSAGSVFDPTLEFSWEFSNYGDAFITFIIRTLAWKTIFADSSFLTSVFEVLGLTTNGRILSTPYAVIGGLTYNFLPFMVLPIYVSIEKIDPRLLEASRDLYASGVRTFRKVLLPLSLPGVFAGSLLTFIPAAGDFVNAQYLGGVNQAMVGTVIQSQFLVVKDYPLAAALSAVLMIIILVMVLVYTRVLGTEDLV